jgi:hypothetical protein
MGETPAQQETRGVLRQRSREDSAPTPLLRELHSATPAQHRHPGERQGDRDPSGRARCQQGERQGETKNLPRALAEPRSAVPFPPPNTSIQGDIHPVSRAVQVELDPNNMLHITVDNQAQSEDRGTSREGWTYHR